MSEIGKMDHFGGPKSSLNNLLSKSVHQVFLKLYLTAGIKKLALMTGFWRKKYNLLKMGLMVQLLEPGVHCCYLFLLDENIWFCFVWTIAISL